MLYDPKWEVKTKADPFTLEALIAWLEKQPRRKEYCYTDHGRCLIGQYLSYIGYDKVHVFSDDLFLHGDREARNPLPSIFNKIALASPRTFGAALDRARKVQALQS